MKQIIMLVTVILLTVNIFAQSPEKMSYQAVVRNASNGLISNTTIGMKISILQGSSSGTVVYAETQSPTTDANGLATLEIGTGSIISGVFSTIDWSVGSYFIKTETDPSGGTTYTITGTTQLMSVPYALHAKTATNFTETDPKIGTNTTGYSPKWNGTALVTGSIYQADSGNVGIGTTSPTNNLSVVGNANFTTSILTPLIQPLSGDGTTLTIQTNNAATVSGDINIKTGNIASNGGSTGSILLSAGKELWTGLSYGASLLLGGYPGSNGSGSAILSGGNSWADGGGDVTLQGGNKGWGNGGSILLRSGNGGGGSGGAGHIIINTGNDTSAGPGLIMMQINGTDALRINSTGNVGIGTTSPTTILDVNGVITATSGNSTNWNTAYGWGNHASAGYVTATYLAAISDVADEFTATTSQTNFTLSQTPATNSKVKMYINGIRISNTAYSHTGTALTYVPANNGSYALASGDRIQFDYYK
ncbi:MAG: hypothetical protein Q7U08_08115 [Flavobacteriaceae bacterium]|nr:hypothetical protein [Flavobacteriaceae bacterium]